MSLPAQGHRAGIWQKQEQQFFSYFCTIWCQRKTCIYYGSSVFLEGNCYCLIVLFAHFIFLGMREEMSHSPKLIPPLLHMLSFIEVPHWLSTRCSMLSPYWRLWQNPRESNQAICHLVIIIYFFHFPLFSTLCHCF